MILSGLFTTLSGLHSLLSQVPSNGPFPDRLSTLSEDLHPFVILSLGVPKCEVLSDNVRTDTLLGGWVVPESGLYLSTDL